MAQHSGLQPVITKLVNKYIDKLIWAERIGIALMFIGAVLFYGLQAKNTLVFGGLLLAVIYFLMAFKSIDMRNMDEIDSMKSLGILFFVYKLAFISLSISMIGILFATLGVNGFMMQCMVGGSSLVLILVYQLINRSKLLDKIFVLRILIVLIVMLIVLTYKYI